MNKQKSIEDSRIFNILKSTTIKNSTIHMGFLPTTISPERVKQ